MLEDRQIKVRHPIRKPGRYCSEGGRSKEGNYITGRNCRGYPVQTYPPIHSWMGESIHSPINPFPYLFIHPSIYSPSVHAPIHPSFHPTVHLSIHPFFYSLFHPSTYPSIHSCVHLPIHPSIHSPTHPLCKHACICSSIYSFNVYF
jgi:hypothetical protein